MAIEPASMEAMPTASSRLVASFRMEIWSVTGSRDKQAEAKVARVAEGGNTKCFRRFKLDFKENSDTACRFASTAPGFGNMRGNADSCQILFSTL